MTENKKKYKEIIIYKIFIQKLRTKKILYNIKIINQNVF